MATDPEDRPLPDRVEGAPHPSRTPRLYGQAKAEAAFLEAFTSGRLHSGWLISGPRGVGKATLAWKIAGFLLSQHPDQGGGLFRGWGVGGAPGKDGPVGGQKGAGRRLPVPRAAGDVDEPCLGIDLHQPVKAPLVERRFQQPGSCVARHAKAGQARQSFGAAPAR